MIMLLILMTDYYLKTAAGHCLLSGLSTVLDHQLGSMSDPSHGLFQNLISERRVRPLQHCVHHHFHDYYVIGYHELEVLNTVAEEQGLIQDNCL